MLPALAHLEARVEGSSRSSEGEIVVLYYSDMFYIYIVILYYSDMFYIFIVVLYYSIIFYIYIVILQHLYCDISIVTDIEILYNAFKLKHKYHTNITFKDYNSGSDQIVVIENINNLLHSLRQ